MRLRRLSFLFGRKPIRAINQLAEEPRSTARVGYNDPVRGGDVLAAGVETPAAFFSCGTIGNTLA
jgi:hypothetical protein